MHFAYIHWYEMVSFFYGNSFESLFMELVLKKATSVMRMHIPFFFSKTIEIIHFVRKKRSNFLSFEKTW